MATAKLIRRNIYYGMNEYRVTNAAGESLGTVTGGGDRTAAGRSPWWTAHYSQPTTAKGYEASGFPAMSRYNRTLGEAVASLERLDREGRLVRRPAR